MLRTSLERVFKELEPDPSPRTEIERLPVRNTNRNWHTLGQGIETSGRSSVKRNVYPIIWPHMPIAKYPVPGPTHKVSGENLKDQG
jgi:hypothetical protein